MRRSSDLNKVLRLCVGVAAVAAVAATGALGGSGGAAIGTAAAKPTLAVVVVGSGRVTSKPAGISCPGKCVATFAAGSRVLLTPKAKKGSRFLRWGGNCAGAGACRVRVSALAAVAAQFTPGTKTQPPPQKSGVEPGTYSAFPVTFYVPAGARNVQNFSNTSASGVPVACAGGGQYFTRPTILKTPIEQDRSFTAKTSESGVVGGAKATLTYSVTGRFQGKSPTGAGDCGRGLPRGHRVHGHAQPQVHVKRPPWTATRSLPPATKSIEAGTYSAFPVTFVVPGGAGSVLNFSNTSASGVPVACAGGGQYFTRPTILKTPIKQDRSFTAKTSESGVVGGASATITYFVTGYFQGPDAQGAATAAGVYRVDIVFADTPSRRCTSNNLRWTATRG